MWRAVWMRTMKSTMKKYPIDMAKYIYISGPVTGFDYEEAKAAFDNAADAIRKTHGNAVEVVNPMDFIGKGEDWDYAMRKCIVKMMDCSYIHLLPGWEKSNGARLEAGIAEGLRFGACVGPDYKLVEYGE